MTAITHITLADSDGAPFVPVARARAANLYERLVRAKQLVGSHRFEVNLFNKTFYVEVRIQRPHVWIYIDSKKCPSYLSGLVWIKSGFSPSVEIDGVSYLRTLFPKDAPTTETDVTKLAGVADQMVSLRPGMFSGEMRKVVQILLGQGRSIPYSPSARVTHGVFRTATGRPWIIRISSDGVVAYPMLVCMGKNTPTDLGYTPLPTEEPENPVVLLDAAGIRDAYTGKSAFYSACGWAFSESGAKAANCFVGSEDIYSYAWQYQISINADPETGDPISASMVRTAEGYIHGPKTTHMKYPRADIPIALRSFDPYRGNANYVKDCAAPVFCFFDGEALQTYYYVYEPSSTFSRTDALTGGVPQTCKEFENVLLKAGDYYETATPVIRLNSTQGYRRKRDNRSTQLYYTQGPLGIGAEAGNFDDGSGFVIEVWMLFIERTSDANAFEDRYDVLIVTGYEREAAYLATENTNSTDGYNYTKESHAIAKHAYNKETVEDCDATSDLRDIEFMVADYRNEVFADSNCASGIRHAWLNGYYVFPGTGPGSNIRWREQRDYVPGWNGCLDTWHTNARFYAPNINDIKDVDVDFPAKSETSYSIALRGSGGFRAAIDADSAEGAKWMRFIESGLNDQTAIVVRDAFNPSRAAYSTAVNKERGFELRESSAFSPYDLASVSGSTLLFVGVP